MTDIGICESCGEEDFVEPCSTCLRFVCGGCFLGFKHENKCKICKNEKLGGKK